MGTATVIEPLGENRSFQPRHGARVAIIGGGMLGTTLALRYRQAGRIVTVYEAAERVERRGHATIASRDRALLSLLDELNLSRAVRWDGASINGARFGALPGGRARIIETLRDRARALDVDVRLGTPVETISTDGAGFQVEAGIETGEFDEIVMTVPATTAAQLAASLPAPERPVPIDVGYVGIITVSFVVRQRRRPAGARYISHVVAGRDRFAVFDPSALLPSDERNVLYVNRPFAADSGLFSAGDRDVIEHFARALPGSSDIVSARVVRMPHAFAQRHLGSFDSDVPGLVLVNAGHMRGGRHYLERTAALAMNAFRTLCSEHIS